MEGCTIKPHSRKAQPIVRMLLSTLLISALFLSSVVPAFADDGQGAPLPLTADNVQAFLDEFFSSEMSQTMYSGAAVAIVKDDEVIALEGYGYADHEKETPVDPSQSIFRIASVSKTFTAVAVMQLAEQGKIDLHEDIRTYLPGLDFDNPYDTPVTVSHLLTHQSGFEVRDPQQSDITADLDLYVSIEEFAAQRMPDVVREPGTSYLYDNFAYQLLGLIVQNVSGMPFEEYMQVHIFEPLGMDNSGYLLKGKFLKHLVRGYDLYQQPVETYAFVPTVMPEGGMLSTADDISKFMLAFLNGGALGSQRILTEQSVEEMSIYRSAIHPLLPNTTYGFEAQLQQFPMAGSPEAVIVKLGDMLDTSSMLMLIPEEKVGVFLTYNQQGVLRDVFNAQFMSTFFPQYTAPAELAPFEPYTVEQLTPLAGYYSDLRRAPLVTKIDVIDDGTIQLYNALLGPRQLRQVDERLFIDEELQIFTAFTIDEASGRAYMKEPYINPLGYARQGEKPVGFIDLAADNVYSEYILTLQSLGWYPNESGAAFAPEEEVTRAELVHYIVSLLGVIVPEFDQYAFTDIAGHEYADEIQFAHLLGMVNGDGGGRFHPDQPAARQEAAVMLWNVLKQQYPDELFASVALAGYTDEWAVPAVKMMAALGYHGPEVTYTEDGAVDFHSTHVLTRQEAAALYYQILMVPSDLIVAEMTAQAQEQIPPVEEQTPAQQESPSDEDHAA